jgi:hypothetical protein
MKLVPYEKKKKIYGNRKHYSVVSKLEQNGIINEQFQLMMNRLSLEEVIAVKLELASRASGGFIYGIPIWASLVNIVRDATLKFALTATRTKAEAARFLGLTVENFNLLIKHYETENYFEDTEHKN